MHVICMCVLGEIMKMMTRIFISVAHISLFQDFPLQISHLRHILREVRVKGCLRMFSRRVVLCLSNRISSRLCAHFQL